MSPKHDKNVPQLVEKYRKKYPALDRDLLRKLIRLENKIENPSELRKLDRYLKKEFDGVVNINPKEEKMGKQHWFVDWWERRAERKERERDEELNFIQSEIDVLLEGFELDPNDPEYFKKENALRRRIQKEYGLIS